MEYKGRIIKLIDAIAASDDPCAQEDLANVYDALEAFIRYIERIYEMETKAPILYRTLSGEACRSAYQDLDSLRTSAHNTAIGKVELLNRLSVLYGVPMVLEELQGASRREVAAFCMAFVTEIFDKRP